MNIEKSHVSWKFLIYSCTVIFYFLQTSALAVGTRDDTEVKLEPAEAIVFAGDSIDFTCSFPKNVSFQWYFSEELHPYKAITGHTTINNTNTETYWSRITFTKVKRNMSGEITCSVYNNKHVATAFLVVNGIRIGGICNDAEDCVTDKAICHRGACDCPQNYVLLRLTESGFEVCRKMIYKLYDPCEFNEQCFHLVDSKSVCSANGMCVCASWAIEINGKCISKSEISYTKNQEMYRVGLIAITCVIIIIVAVALWVTLRRSCNEQIRNNQRESTENMDTENPNGEVIVEIAGDKPPSYDDVLEKNDTISSPPNFKDALKHSTTAKKLLRQFSAPAGQLLSGPTTPNAKTNISHKPDR